MVSSPTEYEKMVGLNHRNMNYKAFKRINPDLSGLIRFYIGLRDLVYGEAAQDVGEEAPEFFH